MNEQHLPKKKILLLDQDEVLADFYSHPSKVCPTFIHNHKVIYERGYFEHLRPLPGALESVRFILDNLDYDVYICTHPLEYSRYGDSEKRRWVDKYLPELSEKMILTCDKGLIKGDFLVDDSMKWKAGFEGEFVFFDRSKDSEDMWLGVIELLIERS